MNSGLLLHHHAQHHSHNNNNTTTSSSDVEIRKKSNQLIKELAKVVGRFRTNIDEKASIITITNSRSMDSSESDMHNVGGGGSSGFGLESQQQLQPQQQQGNKPQQQVKEQAPRTGSLVTRGGLPLHKHHLGGPKQQASDVKLIHP